MPDLQRDFRLRPLKIAVAATLLAPGLAAALPTPTQIPGQGFKAAGPASISVTASTTTPMTVTMSSTTTVASPTGVVIQWGDTSAPTLNSGGTAGFNIGSSASVTFQNSVSGSPTVNVLNVDASGTPSYIEGSLNYSGPGSLWVANGNGVLMGSGAMITVPDGLGLIDEPLQTVTNAYLSFVDSGSVPVDFAGNVPAANAGLSLADSVSGAGISAGFAVLVGANAVNVGDVAGLSGASTLSVDGGIGGSVEGISSGIPVFVPNDQAGSGYADVKTNVGLNLGASSANGFDASGLHVYADGNVTNTGWLTNISQQASQGTLEWINGTLTNTGELDFASTSGYAYLGFASSSGGLPAPAGPIVLSTSLYGSQTSPQGAGAFVNKGTLSAASASSGLVFAGAAFTNWAGGTITLADGAALDLLAYSGGISLGGSVTDTGTLGSLYLAATSPQTVIVDTPVTVTSGATVYGANFVLNSTLRADNFAFVPANSGEVDINGTLTVSATGAIWLGVANANSALPILTNYRINGAVSGGSVVFGGNGSLLGSSSSWLATGDVTGTGSITAASLLFLNLKGSVHNLQTSNIALNGFRINAMGVNPVNISVTATGAGAQGFNLYVSGAANLDSGDTQAVGVSGSAPDNANSIYYLQATGAITIDPNSFADSNYDALLTSSPQALTWSPFTASSPAFDTSTMLFQWPGLVYIQSNYNGSVGDEALTVDGIIANAWTPTAELGRAGIFLLGNTIKFTGYPGSSGTEPGPILTNGNAGVVMAAPFNGYNFGYANITNTPTVYFWRDTSPAPSLLPTDAFTNENGDQQELQTFLTLYPSRP